jgi:hypothetical protein
MTTSAIVKAAEKGLPTLSLITGPPLKHYIFIFEGYMVSWRFRFPPTRIRKTPTEGGTRWFLTPKEVGGGGDALRACAKKEGWGREARASVEPGRAAQ